MTIQVERAPYDKLWHALTRKPSDEAMGEMINNTLSEQEAKQLRMRFGLTGRSPTSLLETANRFETDEDGVRKTEALALRKLRGALARSLHI